jgi:hypothetical protein
MIQSQMQYVLYLPRHYAGIRSHDKTGSDVHAVTFRTRKCLQADTLPDLYLCSDRIVRYKGYQIVRFLISEQAPCKITLS